MPSYTYNTRTAWALLLLSAACDSREFREAAVRNVEYALTQQAGNGYFCNNCLDESDRALSHTIAYCLRGILEVGILTAERRFLESVVLAAGPLLRAIRGDGSLAGRFDPSWRPAVTWSCLTGNSQLALTFGRMYEALGDAKYLAALAKINNFQRSVQILDAARPDLHGGVCGSYPIHGEYGRFEIASWAVKFFMDALMLELQISERKPILLGLPDRHGTVTLPSGRTGSGGGAARGDAAGDGARTA
jgi:hypothetical protein